MLLGRNSKYQIPKFTELTKVHHWIWSCVYSSKATSNAKLWMSRSSSDSVLVSTYKTFQIFDGIDAGDFCASAKKAHHQIWIFVDVSKCMIGKEDKRFKFIWGASLSETILVRKYKIFKSASEICLANGQLNLWWNLTIECRVEYINQKPLQMNNYKCQNHLQTRF